MVPENPGPVPGKFLKPVFCILFIFLICFPAAAFPDNLTGEVSNVTAHLAGLDSDIREKQALGVDTLEAENFSTIASRQLSSAKDNLTRQNYSTAVNDLVAADASIEAGERAVGRAWAEDETMNARVSLDNAISIIAFIGQDQDPVNSTGYREVIAQKEVAERYLAAANSEIANGNYTRGYELAQNAWIAGNESYTGALAIVPKHYTGPEDRWVLLKLALSDARVLGIAVIVGTVLVAALVLLLQKKIPGGK